MGTVELVLDDLPRRELGRNLFGWLVTEGEVVQLEDERVGRPPEIGTAAWYDRTTFKRGRLIQKSCFPPDQINVRLRQSDKWLGKSKQVTEVVRALSLGAWKTKIFSREAMSLPTPLQPTSR